MSFSVTEFEGKDGLPASLRGLGALKCCDDLFSIDLYIEAPDGSAYFVRPIELRKVGPDQMLPSSFLLANDPHIAAVDLLQAMLDAAWARGLRPTGQNSGDVRLKTWPHPIVDVLKSGFVEVAGDRIGLADIGIYNHLTIVRFYAYAHGRYLMVEAAVGSERLWSPGGISEADVARAKEMGRGAARKALDALQPAVAA